MTSSVAGSRTGSQTRQPRFGSGRRLSLKKRIAFAVVVSLLALVAAAGSLVAVDVYLHLRLERSAGVNVWGYRGPVAGRKAPGELRVAFLGGSTAFGYGVTNAEAIPTLVEEHLRARRASNGQGPVSVVNLAYNNEGAYSFTFTLRDYAYLDYDIVCLYQGYNDLGERRNTQVFRHESPVFRLTGYLPIFPLVFKEKAASILAGGDPSALYRHSGDEKTVFRPGLATKAAAETLNATAAIGESLEKQLGRLSAEAPPPRTSGSDACAPPWGDFCHSIFDAVDLSLSEGKRVLVVTQPYLTVSEERNRSQQAAMRAGLLRRYTGDHRVQHVDFGEAIDLHDSKYSYDSMHLTAAGNAIIADRLVDPVLSLAAASP